MPGIRLIDTDLNTFGRALDLNGPFIFRDGNSAIYSLSEPGGQTLRATLLGSFSSSGTLTGRIEEIVVTGPDGKVLADALMYGFDVDTIRAQPAENRLGFVLQFPDYIQGNSGANTLLGFGSGDVLDGLEGDDTLTGGSGSDTLFGGAGSDTAVFSGARSDYSVTRDATYVYVQDLRGGAVDGRDVLADVEFLRFGTSASQPVSTAIDGNGTSPGTPGQPGTGGGLAVPTPGNDDLDGTEGDDTITALAGQDNVRGRGGHDIISGQQGNDTVAGNAGRDTLYGGQGNDLVFGGQDADTLFGNLGDDVLAGNLGDDVVYGGQGNDTIYGGQGSDTIIGALGNDLLFGNLGADRFVFGQVSGDDRVAGFSQAEGDRLDLQGQSYVVGSSSDGFVRLTLSGGGTVALTGVNAAQINGGFFA